LIDPRARYLGGGNGGAFGARRGFETRGRLAVDRRGKEEVRFAVHVLRLGTDGGEIEKKWRREGQTEGREVRGSKKEDKI
jgi:hypothetical protein